MTETVNIMKPKAHFVEPDYAARMFRDDDIYRERCKAQAREWARANKADPFAYARALNDYTTGVAFAGTPTGSLFNGAEGYNVVWSQEPRTSMLGDIAVNYFVPVPLNMKRP